MSRRGGVADEVYGALREVLLGRARKPMVLRDEGEGETLKRYEVGVARVRVANLRGEGLYLVSEPELAPQEELLYAYVLQKMVYELKPGQEAGEAVKAYISRGAEALKLSGRADERKIAYYINREVFGYGPVDTPVRDDEIEDIKCVGVGKPVTVIHREFGRLGWLRTNIEFKDEDYLADFVRRVAHRGGRGISTAIPYVDCQITGVRTEKGKEVSMRFAGTIGREITRGGSTFVVRKFPANPFSLAQLVRGNMLSSLMAAYLWFVAENKRIFFVAGPTGSGKTTLLNAILGVLDPRLSYITIEDVYELHLPAWRWIQMTTRRSWALIESRYEIKIEDLIAMSMRMRPDYLIVGEVRTPEQLVALLLSATTGHGAMTSIHAQDPESLLVRLLTMRINRDAVDLLWGCAITQPVEVGKAGGSDLKVRRRVTKIAEFNPVEEGTEVVDVFTYMPEEDAFAPESVEELWRASKRLPTVSESLKLSKEAIVADIERKKLFIEGNLDSSFDLLSQRASRMYSERLGAAEKRVEV